MGIRAPATPIWLYQPSLSRSYFYAEKTTDRRDRNVTSERLGGANGGSARANAGSRMFASRWKLCVASSPRRLRLLALITQRSSVETRPAIRTCDNDARVSRDFSAACFSCV